MFLQPLRLELVVIFVFPARKELHEDRGCACFLAYPAPHTRPSKHTVGTQTSVKRRNALLSPVSLSELLTKYLLTPYSMPDECNDQIHNLQMGKLRP